MAFERDELDAWRDDLGVMARALQDEELTQLLDAPHVPIERKLDTVGRVLDDSVGTLPRNMLSLLASRNMSHLVPAILDRYSALLDAHRGIERAEVVSAVELSDVQREKVADLLREIVGKEIRLTSRVDPQVLGGLVARVGDRIIDGSARSRLEGLRQSLGGSAS